jgi:hypothetical protein
MKSASKLAYPAWTAYWSFVILRFSLRDISWSLLQIEPEVIVVPLLCRASICFAVGLWLERCWGWIGAFSVSVLSLFVALYFILSSVGMVAAEGWRHWRWIEFTVEFAWCVAAILLLILLPQARHSLFESGNE